MCTKMCCNALGHRDQIVHVNLNLGFYFGLELEQKLTSFMSWDIHILKLLTVFIIIDCLKKNWEKNEND